MRRPIFPVLALSIAIAGCSAAVTSSGTPSIPPSPSTTAAATAAVSPSPSQTHGPSLPPGTSAWPTTFAEALTGTFWSSPPFRIPFAITVDEPGWYSGHVNEEFIDIQRFDGMDQRQFPNRVLGFGDPDRIRGLEGPIDVASLTPDAALDLLTSRASLTAENRASVEIFGIRGARLDLHSATSNNPLFGGVGGDFGLGPELDIRLVLLPLDGRLLVVAVLAAPGDLEGAWEQALPILGTVRLGDE